MKLGKVQLVMEKVVDLDDPRMVRKAKKDLLYLVAGIVYRGGVEELRKNFQVVPDRKLTGKDIDPEYLSVERSRTGQKRGDR